MTAMDRAKRLEAHAVEYFEMWDADYNKGIKNIALLERARELFKQANAIRKGA
jgi:hypothetical protein